MKYFELNYKNARVFPNTAGFSGVQQYRIAAECNGYVLGVTEKGNCAVWSGSYNDNGELREVSGGSYFTGVGFGSSPEKCFECAFALFAERASGGKVASVGQTRLDVLKEMNENIDNEELDLTEVVSHDTRKGNKIMADVLDKKAYERVTFSNDNETLNLFLIKKWTGNRFGTPIEFTFAADEPIYSELDETTPIYQLSDELYECMKSTLYSKNCYLQADVKDGTNKGQYLIVHSKDEHWKSIDDLDIELLSSIFLKNEIGSVNRSNFEYWAGGSLGHCSAYKMFYKIDNAYFMKESHFDDLLDTPPIDIYKVDYQDVVDEFAKAHNLTELDCVVENSGEFWCHDEGYGDGNISYSIYDKQLKENVIAATTNNELDLTQQDEHRGR